MEEATSNGGANGQQLVWLWLKLPGFQNWEAEFPEISDM